MEADIHIVTGLVEPHFMAGVSGGRKAICPGLINLEATHLFHGVEFMDNPCSTNLVLENNPCHEFALKVARKVRVDFSINVTINGDGNLTGVFAGDLEKSHLEAVKRLKESSVILCDHEYDIVLTQGGKVAVNHYQAAKAAYGTCPIIKKGGMVILVAHNSDEEPVGKEDYKKVLEVLKEKGPGRFTEFIKSKDWQFIPDQWQVQKWDQFFKKIAFFDNLIYCTTGIPPEELKKLPGRSGYEFVQGEKIEIDKMVQNAIFYAVRRLRQKLKKDPEMAFVKEGPYAVPTAVEVCEVKDDRVKEKVKKLLKTAHLSVAYCAHPKILTGSLDLNSGAEELIFLSGKDPGEERRDDARRLLTFSIKDICAYAKSRGDLRITLEIFDREVEKRCLIGPADEARMVAEEVRREFDNFGLLVDLSHIPLLNETPAEAILPVKDYLVHAHLGNCVLKDTQHPAYGDSHPRFGIEGGENDVEEVVKFLEVLFEVGFLNEDNPPMVSFEIKPLADESAQVVIANAKRVLREAWVRLNI